MNLPRIQPINPTRIAAPFDHPDWLFELKHDGYRAVAYIENGKCELVSRKQNVYKRFGQLAGALTSELRVKNAIIDGEIVCLDGQGRSLFLELLRHRSVHPVLYAFDLLWLDGDDLRGLPLIERKRQLKRLTRSSRCSQLLFADHIEARGIDFFRAICERDCEGIIAKPKDSIYSTAGPAAWFKVLNPAYTQKQGRKELFESFHERQNIPVG